MVVVVVVVGAVVVVVVVVGGAGVAGVFPDEVVFVAFVAIGRAEGRI